MKKTWAIGFCIFIFAFLLRSYHFEGRAPFDWDQNRDYGEVRKIASGHYVPLGPIAKGVGGFYLGSLYYYVLAPGYLISHGSLSSLPLTSLSIDALFSGLVYVLLSSVIGKTRAFYTAILWTMSWFILDSSRISWNVALIPLWSLFTIYTLYQIIDHHSPKNFYLLGLLAGLTLHIHVATIPVIPIFIVLFYRHFRYSLKSWLIFFLFAMIPVVPLCMYDLTHQFANLHLLKSLIRYQNSAKAPILPMIMMTITKLGKVVSGLFFGNFSVNIYLGILTLMLSTWAAFSKPLFSKIAGLNVIISTLLIIALHDYGFPEYYFAPAYFSLFVICITTIYTVWRWSLPGKIVASSIIILFFLGNISKYSVDPTGFSLLVKTQIVDSLRVVPGPLDIHYSFDPGRDGGLSYLVSRSGIVLDTKSKTRILLTDKLNTPLYIEGELTRDLRQIGNIRSSIYIVQ